MAAGLYDITNETLGKGHFAVVKLARHCLSGESVAVKIIDKSKLNNEGLQQLGMEIRLLSRLSEQEHPNIVKLYQVIDTKSKLYLVMEYCGKEVCDLYDYIQKKNCGNGLKEWEAKHIFKQICSAIDYCHSLSIVHRDLKPENILIITDKKEDKDDEYEDENKYPLVKLIDFGFSNQWDEGEKLRTSCGSLAYSPPEILLGDHYDGDKVDIWGLGCILYILLYGSNPFMQINDSETLIRILDCTFTTPPRPTISDNSISLIKALLKRDPKSRLKIRQVLQHHWLTGDVASAENSENVNINTSQEDESIINEINDKVGEIKVSTSPLSFTNKNINKINVHNSVIEHMLTQGMCTSRDQIEDALVRSKSVNSNNSKTNNVQFCVQSGADTENCVNGDKDATLSQDNYIIATYHLLKDKMIREHHSHLAHHHFHRHLHHPHSQTSNANFSTSVHQHRRLLPHRTRKLGQLGRRSNDANSTSDPSINTNKPVIAPLMDIYNEDEKTFLPLARKCSIVSEEGSCAGTDHSSNDGGNDNNRINDIEKFELSSSFPSVDIIVTDYSNEEIREDVLRESQSEEKLDTFSRDIITKSLNSSASALHLASSSPELRDEEFDAQNNSDNSHGHSSKCSTQGTPMIITDISDKKVSHDDIGDHLKNQITANKNANLPSISTITAQTTTSTTLTTSTASANLSAIVNTSLPSTATSMRVIVQSKSCNNILLADDTKSTSFFSRSNGCNNKLAKKKKIYEINDHQTNDNNSLTNNTEQSCQKIVKRSKHERIDCCLLS